MRRLFPAFRDCSTVALLNADHVDKIATAAAEEILRVIYGNDLEGCAVSVEPIAAVVRDAIEQSASHATALAQLHEKGFEAMQLLSTPPSDGALLSAEDLRTLLGERLDEIRNLASRIVAATRGVAAETTNTNGHE